jgi:hypothetical protein
MAIKPVMKRNDFIEISGKYYFVVNINRPDLDDFDNVDDDLNALSNAAGTWYSCISSRGRHVTIFDPLNSRDFGIVCRKWIGSDGACNGIIDLIADFIHDNFLTRLVDRIRNDIVFWQSRRSGLI